MGRGRNILRVSAAVCALVGIIWGMWVMQATDARQLTVLGGAVAALSAAAGLALGAASGAPRLGTLAAAPTALLLGLKPYLRPLWYRGYKGDVSVFSPAAETHLYYLVPGFVLGVIAIAVAFVPLTGRRGEARDDLLLFFRASGGGLGLFAATGLLLIFTNSRGELEMVLTALVPSALVGVASLASIVGGGAGDKAPLSAGQQPYRMAAPMVSSISAPMGEATDALMRALAHAPAPGLDRIPPALLELPPGSRVGSFVVRDRLGAGGMGIVYRARDERLGREVALKLLPPHLAADPTRRARFFREARTAASVLHANVAAVYELGEADPPYIAMELVPGETLARRIARGFVGVPEVHRIALAVASGLAAAHDRGVVHRDLKPENVMIAADGSTKIVDFGLARADGGLLDPTGVTAIQGSLTQSGFIVGTPRYMAPEQAMGGEVDARADVYAFGLLVLELCTGAGLDPATPAIRRGDAARGLVGRVVPGLGDLVARCLAFDPEARFADARQLVEALQEAAVKRGAA